MDDTQPRPSNDHPLPSAAPTEQFAPVSDPAAWAPPAAWGPPTTPPAGAAHPAGTYGGWAPPAAAPAAAWGEPASTRAQARRRGVARGALIAVPALLVGAAAATVVTLAVADHHTAGSTSASSSTTSTVGKHEAGGKSGKGAQRTTGTLTATNGSTWTVQTSSGPVTVDLGSKTAYGTATQPSQESAFHAGEKVAVAGKRSGDTVAATRVRAVTS